MASKKIALVTGGNRGIGYQVCKDLARKGFTVLLAARDTEKGQKAAESLKRDGDVRFLPLDVSNERSIDAAFIRVQKEFGRLDVLVNNAGVFLDESSHDPVDKYVSAFHADPKPIVDTFITNSLGPFLMCQKFIPLMIEGGGGRVINLSSGMGQLSEMEGTCPGYRMSKSALNAVTRIFATECERKKVSVNSVCPGWVKTDMGGPNAERPVEQGADTIVWLATDAEAKLTGGFYRDREVIAW